MEYMRMFKTTSEYAAYSADTANFITPNVSLCEDALDYTYYNPYMPPAPPHDYVEIAGIKWATMNVGATGVTDYGLHFQWGDTQGYTADQVGCEEGKKCFDNYWSDYKWTEDGGETFTKYNGSDYTVLQPSDDAVTAAWGGNWRMPTKDEYVALANAVNTAYTQVNGVNGLQCTDKTDSSKTLFFPAAGYFYDGVTPYVGYYGRYWSSSPDTNSRQSAYGLSFNSSDAYWDDNNGTRYLGCAVRPVVG